MHHAHGKRARGHHQIDDQEGQEQDRPNLEPGFQIGAILFLPFLLVDIVVASVTLSIGMVQLPPVMVSAPFKILLFVLVDGWNLVIGSLMKSFYL